MNIQGAIAAEAHALRRTRRGIPMIRRGPIFRKIKRACPMPSGAAVGVLELGAPPAGRIWDVRRVSVSGADPLEPLSGIALICVGASPAAPQRAGTEPIDPLSVFDSTDEIPADLPLSEGELIVCHSELLFVVFANVDDGAICAVHANVLELVPGRDVALSVEIDDESALS